MSKEKSQNNQSDLSTEALEIIGPEPYQSLGDHTKPAARRHLNSLVQEHGLDYIKKNKERLNEEMGILLMH